jgi:hypothetical protein
VSNLRVLHRKGQSFITFNETAGKGVTYNVYRSRSRITDTTNLTPIATLPQGTSKLKYTGRNLVITDRGKPLPENTGLLVWTTEADGAYYYAVTNSTNKQTVPGGNVLSTPVTETHDALPGAVQINDTQFFAWEDYKSWDHNQGYYGFTYGVIDKSGGKQPAPMTVWLHGAQHGYLEGGLWAPNDPVVWVLPVDFRQDPDPYTGQDRYFSMWFGWPHNGVVRNSTEQRIIRYCRLTMQDPKYNIDPNRIYAQGGSMGGGGSLHLAYHYPQFFAAVWSVVPWISPETWLFEQGHIHKAFGTREQGLRANSPTGPLVWNWLDMRWVAANNPASTPLPPLILFFRPDDPILRQTEVPQLLQKTTANKKYALAQWAPGLHKGWREIKSDEELPVQDMGTYYLRFRRDEAYPAFASASSNDAFSSERGQFNGLLDWSSSLRDFSPDKSDDIADTRGQFAITLKSLKADATAQVTIRNAQQFKLTPGQSVGWTNAKLNGHLIKSGTAKADKDGLVTLDLDILAEGNRLSLQPAL